MTYQWNLWSWSGQLLLWVGWPKNVVRHTLQRDLTCWLHSAASLTNLDLVSCIPALIPCFVNSVQDTETFTTYFHFQHHSFLSGKAGTMLLFTAERIQWCWLKKKRAQSQTVACRRRCSFIQNVARGSYARWSSHFSASEVLETAC